MTRRVLLTRPEALAAPLAAKLEAQRCEVWCEPMLFFEPLEKKRPDGFFNGVLLTSRLALVAMKERREELADLLAFPCYAVGERTAQDARSFGFEDVREGSANSAALAARVAQDQTKERSFLHVGNEDTRPTVWESLKSFGQTATPWPVYRTVPREIFSETFRERARQGIAYDFSLFFSPKTARTYVRLAEESGLSLYGAGTIAIGLSEAVADPLRSLRWLDVRVAEVPREESILAEVFA